MWSCQPYLNGIDNRFPYPENTFKGMFVFKFIRITLKTCEDKRFYSNTCTLPFDSKDIIKQTEGMESTI